MSCPRDSPHKSGPQVRPEDARARGPAGSGPESRRRRDDPEQGRAVLDEALGVGGMELRPGTSSTDFGDRTLVSAPFDLPWVHARRERKTRQETNSWMGRETHVARRPGVVYHNRKVGHPEYPHTEGRMARKDTATRLVRLQAKGQLTLPAQFRRRLNVDEDTILRITLRDAGITITPLRPERTDSSLREFSQADITRFLREDRLDRATAAKVQRLLGRTKAA